MELHKVWLDEKLRLAGTAAADHQDILIPGILRVLWAAAHHQPFHLGQQHVVLKHRVYVRLYILRCSP